jgi:penicillin V acylase-like amidase (Ntn superfamily)
MLANFGSVAEVRAALDPAKFSVVNFWMPARALRVLRDAGLIGDGGFATIHFAVHDARHDSLVIEFTGAPAWGVCHISLARQQVLSASVLHAAQAWTAISRMCCARTRWGS